MNQWKELREREKAVLGKVVEEVAPYTEAVSLKVARLLGVRGRAVEDDFRQEAFLCTLDCLRRFDKEVGAPFGSFYTQTLYWALVNKFRDCMEMKPESLSRRGVAEALAAPPLVPSTEVTAEQLALVMDGASKRLGRMRPTAAVRVAVRALAGSRHGERLNIKMLLEQCKVSKGTVYNGVALLKRMLKIGLEEIS